METLHDTQVFRDASRCDGTIKEVNFRETEGQFIYRGIRGIVMTEKNDDRAGAYLTFIGTLRDEFNPTHIYHQVDRNRFEVPDLDEESAVVFLDIIDKAHLALSEFAA